MKGEILMKLNPDCIRDILLTVEETTTYSKLFEFDEDDIKQERLKTYNGEEILYHLRQCKADDFFLDCKFTLDGICLINDLSPKAHRFLADIRSDTIWNKTKEKAKSIGSYSLDVLVKIASGVVTTMVNSALQGTQP
jgi:hypothetical protein